MMRMTEKKDEKLLPIFKRFVLKITPAEEKSGISLRGINDLIEVTGT